MDEVVRQHGPELLSYIGDRNTCMFNQKLREISANEKILRSLLTWTSNNDEEHKHTLLMSAIKLNNQEIFDILMQNKVRNLLYCFCTWLLTANSLRSKPERLTQ